MSNSNLPYGLTWVQNSGVSASAIQPASMCSSDVRVCEASDFIGLSLVPRPGMK